MEDKYSNFKNSSKKVYEYEDYRNEIAEIMQRNGRRIKIKDVLAECGISKGNYYSFMNGGRKYKDHDISTLSYAKLDILLSALRKIDHFATNRKKLSGMSDEDLARFIEEKIVSDPKAAQIDFLAWFKSTDPAFIYKDKNKE